jgi:hypothetical protein
MERTMKNWSFVYFKFHMPALKSTWRKWLVVILFRTDHCPFEILTTPPSRPTSQKLYCDANLLGNLSWDMVGNALQFFMSIALIVSWGKLDGGTVQLVCEPIPWHLLRNVMMQFVSYLNSRLKAVYLAVNLPSNYIYIAYTDFFPYQ